MAASRNRSAAAVLVLGMIVALTVVSSAQASVATSYAQIVLASHPTAYYQFNDASGSTSFVDSSGNGKTATSDGSDKIASPGPFGAGSHALTIGDDGAQAPALTPMQGDNARTVELWFNTTQTSDQCLLSTGSQTHAAAFSLCLTDGQQFGAPPPNTPGVYLQTFDSDLYLPSANLTDGRWHYIAVTLSGSTVTFDIDGQAPAGYVWNGSAYSNLTQQPLTLPNQPNTAATAVGIGSASWAGVFTGQIADGAIYPSALSTNTLSAHYAAGSSAGCAVRLLPGTHEPAIVTVFVDGVQTTTPNDDFYPLNFGLGAGASHTAIDSYCSPYNASSFGRFPPSVSGVLQGYVGTLNPPPPEGTEILTDTLARQGAVLLPYSYKGAYFKSCPGGGSPPLFHVNYSSSSDPGNTDPNTQAGLLWGEVQSIHSCWPRSAIEIIADSGGGVPAEYYWNTAFQNERDGVAHVFTLDSPINGMDHTSIESVVDNHLGPVVRDFYGVLWNNLDSNDQQELSRDGDGSFRPIGTIGDYAFALGNMRWSFNFDPSANDQNAALNALLSQILMNCSGGLSDTCSPVGPPDYISPCSGTQYSGDPSHEVVRICKPTVEYIKGLVSADSPAEADRSTRAVGHSCCRASAAAAHARHVNGPGPAVQPLLYAASPGQRITIHGRGLGSTAGTVSFTGAGGPGTVPALVAAWSDTTVSVSVPKAISGPIILTTHAGVRFPASSIAMLAPGRVTRLTVHTSHPVEERLPEYVQITALDHGSHPVSHALVDLFNGSRDATAHTGGNGTVTFTVFGTGTEDFLAHSQSASARVKLTWRPKRQKPFGAIGFTISHDRVDHAGNIIINLLADTSGRFTGLATICTHTHGTCHLGASYGTAHVSSTKAGKITLTIKPGHGATGALKSHMLLRVSVTVTLRPTLGKTVVRKTFLVAFKG